MLYALESNGDSVVFKVSGTTRVGLDLIAYAGPTFIPGECRSLRRTCISSVRFSNPVSQRPFLFLSVSYFSRESALFTCLRSQTSGHSTSLDLVEVMPAYTHQHQCHLRTGAGMKHVYNEGLEQRVNLEPLPAQGTRSVFTPCPKASQKDSPTLSLFFCACWWAKASSGVT